MTLCSNQHTNAYVPMQGGSLYHFRDGLWHDPAGTRTHAAGMKGRHANH